MSASRKIIGTIANYRENVFIDIHQEIQNKIKELLEKKHLYQSVRIDVDPIKKSISKAKRARVPFVSLMGRGPRPSQQEVDKDYRQELQGYLDILLNCGWKFATEVIAFPSESQQAGSVTHENEIRIILPTIKIPCAHCDNEINPHNSGYKGLLSNFQEIGFHSAKSRKQLFLFPYQCQSCKSEPLIFMVKREDTKLQIVGRNLIEVVLVPKYIPKEDVKYYREAIIAFNCGKTLAALFFLRTMIEQYLKRILSVSNRISGDILCDKYSEILPPDFPKGRFISLKKIYEELSVCVHQVKEDEVQFLKSRKDIEKHFDLLQHFPLINKPKEKE